MDPLWTKAGKHASVLVSLIACIHCTHTGAITRLSSLNWQHEYHGSSYCMHLGIKRVEAESKLMS